MDEKLLRAVQLEQLSIMEKIHEYCVDHSIQYYIIGGSALGAIRHGGFIPWDVDVDIAMTRENYRKFAEAFKANPIEELEYYDYRSLKLYNPPHAIIIKKGTELFRKDRAYNKKFRPMGVFVDVLPLDKAPDTQFLREIQSRLLRLLAQFKYYKIATYFPENDPVKKMIRLVLRSFLLIFPMRFLNYLQQQTMMAFDSSSTECICSMSSHYSYKKQCMPIYIYGEPTLYKFEDKIFYGPNKPIEYLKRIYGDYNRIPKPTEQKEQKSYFYDAKL